VRGRPGGSQPPLNQLKARPRPLAEGDEFAIEDRRAARQDRRKRFGDVGEGLEVVGVAAEQFYPRPAAR
jgi:hypothetical protein